MKKVEKNYNLDINYSAIFKDWSHYLNKLLTSTYMHNLMVFLRESYKFKVINPKNKQLLFKPFTSIRFQEVRVVIIAKEPYQNNVNTGIPLATKETIFDLEKGLSKIEKNIENTVYDGFKLYLDPSLEHWYQQGVLTLYSALTVEKGIEGSHQLQWRNFTREIVKSLSENRTGLIFLLWGDEAKEFKNCIDRKVHYVLEDNGPFTNDKEWDCNHFKEVNNIIELNNGKEYNIRW